jgi:hypothetical protein
VKRRELIETGIGGMALLALASCARPSTPAAAFHDDGYNYAILTPGDRTMIAALSTAILAGALPAGAAAAGALVQVVRGVDVAISGLTPSVQQEVSQLFALLEFPVTRAFAAGIWSGWDGVSAGDADAFLTRWRYSGVALFRSGYQALHQLVMASWYGNGASWPRIGYPGPPAVG